MLNQVFFRAEVDQHHTVASHLFWVIWKTLKQRLVIDLRARTLHDLLFSATHHLFSHFLFTWAAQTCLLIFIVNRSGLWTPIWPDLVPGVVLSRSFNNSHFPSVCHNYEPKAEFNYILKACVVHFVPKWAENVLQLFLFPSSLYRLQYFSALSTTWVCQPFRTWTRLD